MQCGGARNRFELVEFIPRFGNGQSRRNGAGSEGQDCWCGAEQAAVADTNLRHARALGVPDTASDGIEGGSAGPIARR